jgi:hypothetical protein
MFESLTISNKGVILKESERVFCANEKSTNRFNPFYSWHIFPSGKTTSASIKPHSHAFEKLGTN